MALKVLTAAQIREADAYTIAHEPIASIDLMERAAGAFTEILLQEYDLQGRPVAVFCGTGNNGGDGLAVARMLQHSGAQPLVIVAGDTSKSTADFQINYRRARDASVRIVQVENDTPFPDIDPRSIIIDALLGTGLSRPAAGIYKRCIDFINQIKRTVVSVDVPSGLYCDRPNQQHDSIVQATLTITFQCPKLSFLLPGSGEYCGALRIADIGLSKEFLQQIETPCYLTEKSDFTDWSVWKRKRFSHKGHFGHLVIAAGSYGKAGAAALCARAAMRCGAGLLTVQTPRANLMVVQTAVPEAMCLADDEERCITHMGAAFADAYAIGPGLGTDALTGEALLKFLIQNQKPAVLDADALNLIARLPDAKAVLNERYVLTPHPGEFARLAGDCENSFSRLEAAREFAMAHRIVLVLKGAYTAVIDNSGKVYFNPTGNPGMATAGSGDVLTGIIGALLAQGLSPAEAARLGVYLHGIAGDMAADEHSQAGMIAGDIVRCLPRAIMELMRGEEHTLP
ncbi:MAG: NAD(P)H-hydrate dehydratase [Chitinophagales bacterium]|nr:NAD(P)H-hydrate dehydratase [Chitinophagales bacterium]MDW8418220.1 NAD(P)H-hydrate dehydratase [Chitinophagales bacterium]